MDDQSEAHIPYATGGVVNGSLGTIGCACGCVWYLIPPKRDDADTSEPYDERESNP